MQRYRKKPIIIEAIQFDGTNGKQIVESFINERTNAKYLPVANVISLLTLEGELVANVGDWIIKGVKGEFYPCKPDIFEMTYDKE